MSGWKVPETVRLDDARGAVVIIDQTLLPGTFRELLLRTREEVWEAIRELRVRGAPAIGVAAAAGVYLAVRGSRASVSVFSRSFSNACSCSIFAAAVVCAVSKPTARAVSSSSRKALKLRRAVWMETELLSFTLANSLLTLFRNSAKSFFTPFNCV